MTDHYCTELVISNGKPHVLNQVSCVLCFLTVCYFSSRGLPMCCPRVRKFLLEPSFSAFDKNIDAQTTVGFLRVGHKNSQGSWARSKAALVAVPHKD